MKNPFLSMRMKGRMVGPVDADSRLHMLKGFDLKQCKAALEVPDLQLSVKNRIEARIRKLEKLKP